MDLELSLLPRCGLDSSTPFLVAPQHDGLVWPSEPSRVSRAVPEVRMGSVSLIPLRGSENEMRRSVAAFTADPLSVSGSDPVGKAGWDLAGFRPSLTSLRACLVPSLCFCPPVCPWELQMLTLLHPLYCWMLPFTVTKDLLDLGFCTLYSSSVMSEYRSLCGSGTRHCHREAFLFRHPRALRAWCEATEHTGKPYPHPTS